VATGASGFTNIKTVNRAQEVKAQLLQAIRRGDYRAGDPLPSERELSEAFGVSRVSVREAIRSLEAIGMVEVFHGRGSFVARAPTDRYVGPFTEWLQVHRDAVVEMMQVRGALDELAAAEAAERGNAAEHDRLEAACDAFAAYAETEQEDLDRLAELDIDFHVAIAEASGSSLLRQLVAELNRSFAEGRKIVYAIERRPVRSAAEHRSIVNAIRRGDSRAARAAAARHVASTTSLLADVAEASKNPEAAS
jgi:DNA-binding FadR family transcriptional regulator